MNAIFYFNHGDYLQMRGLIILLTALVEDEESKTFLLLFELGLDRVKIYCFFVCLDERVHIPEYIINRPVAPPNSLDFGDGEGKEWEGKGMEGGLCLLGGMQQEKGFI